MKYSRILVFKGDMKQIIKNSPTQLLVQMVKLERLDWLELDRKVILPDELQYLVDNKIINCM